MATLAEVSDAPTSKSGPGESRSHQLEASFPQISSAQLGMYIGLGSLTVLFLASLVGYFVTRAQASAWRGVDLPSMPWGVWLSSAILIALSLLLRQAENQVRENRLERIGALTQWAFILGLLFCAAQAENWREVAQATMGQTVKGLYIYTFFMLTALHALHVVIGLVPLWLVHRKATAKKYSQEKHEGLHLLRQYWDFLLVVWVVILAALWLS